MLAHLDADHAAGAVLPIRVGDHPPVRYWSPERADLDALRAGTGIPANVSSFGLTTGGIIESEPSARYLIRATRAFFAAVPVGAYVDWVPDELAARRLVDEVCGVITIVRDPVIPALLRRVAEALRHGTMEPSLRAEVAHLLAEWMDRIPAQWQAVGRVDPRVYAHVRALQTALHSCDVPADDAALGRVVNASLHHGVELPWSTGSWSGIREEFRCLLQAAS